MNVDLRHPAPVTWIPRGRRKAVGTFVSTLTPAEMRHVPASSLRHVLDLTGRSASLHEHGGALWRMLDTGHGEDRRPVTPGEWLDFLTSPGRPEGDTASDILRAVRMTPLAALDRASEAWERVTSAQGIRGEADITLGQGRCVADGREAAGRAAAAFLAGECLVTDGGVLLRYRPVAGLEFDMRLRGLALRHVADPLPNGLAPFMMPFHPAFAAEAAAVALDLLAGSVEDGRLRREARILEGFAVGDEDLRLMANWLPCELARILARRVSGPGNPGGLAEIADRLRPLHVAGGLGGIATEEAPEALALFSDLAEEVLTTTLRKQGADQSRLERDLHAVGLYAGAVANRADPEPLADADRDALAGMGP